MASNSQGIRVVLQIVLGLAIVALAYFLYLSITEPYEAVERRQELTRMTRMRMDNVRTAMIFYERENDRYPKTLDSLVTWVKQDSLFSASADSVFGTVGFMADSLIHAPRTGKRFELSVNDTSRVKIYFLKDPDREDQIGSTTPDITMVNAASWE